MPEFEFFYDLHSPYSYLASTQLPALEQRTGTQAIYRPLLLGGIFKETGNRSPASLPSKAQYTWVDLNRWARRYGIPLNWPDWFPGNSLLPMRVLTAAAERSQADCRRLTQALFHAAWVDNVDLSFPEAVVEHANIAGLPGRELAEAARSQEVKDKLKQTTGEAARRGVFGVPAFFIGERKMFFGNDRMDFLEEALAEAAGAPKDIA